MGCLSLHKGAGHLLWLCFTLLLGLKLVLLVLSRILSWPSLLQIVSGTEPVLMGSPFAVEKMYMNNFLHFCFLSGLLGKGLSLLSWNVIVFYSVRAAGGVSTVL